MGCIAQKLANLILLFSILIYIACHGSHHDTSLYNSTLIILQLIIHIVSK